MNKKIYFILFFVTYLSNAQTKSNLHFDTFINYKEWNELIPNQIIDSRRFLNSNDEKYSISIINYDETNSIFTYRNNNLNLIKRYNLNSPFTEKSNINNLNLYDEEITKIKLPTTVIKSYYSDVIQLDTLNSKIIVLRTFYKNNKMKQTTTTNIKMIYSKSNNKISLNNFTININKINITIPEITKYPNYKIEMIKAYVNNKVVRTINFIETKKIELNLMF
jgi:hypothetical protein